MTVRDPGDTYALLVGVDSCKISNDWSLRGPSLDAVRMASFLIGKELSPERMTVLLTIHPEDRDEVTAQCEKFGIEHQDASWGNVFMALGEIPNRRRTTLILFWAGHGVLVEGRQRLLCGDATNEQPYNLDIVPTLDALETDLYPTYINQISVVDACSKAVNSEFGKAIQIASFRANKGLADTSRRRFRFWAAGPGQAASNDDVKKSGRYSTAILDLAGELRITEWPFDPQAVREGIEKKFDQLRAEGKVAAYPEAYFTPPGQEPQPLDLGADQAPAPEDYPLVAYPVALTWTPLDGPLPVSEHAAIRLDIRWCVDRSIRQGVLVDHVSQRLADQLNRVEEVLHRHARAGLRERRWYQVTADECDQTTPHVAVGSRRDDDRDFGFVVRWRAGSERDPADCLTALRRQLAHGATAPVLFQVHGDSTTHAAVAAVAIAGRISEPEVLVRMPAPAVTEQLAARPLPAEPAAAIRQTAVAGKNHGWWPALADVEADILPADAATEQLAEAVIEQLESKAAWGRPEEEERTLAAIRDFAPTFFPAVLRAHATGRRSPLYYISLRVATRRDRELDIWFSGAAARTGGLALVAPPRDFTRTQAESVALAILRHKGFDADLRTWLVRSGSEAAWEVAEYRASERDDGDFLRRSRARTVLAAWRARIGCGVHLAEILHSAGSVGCWALFGRMGVTEDSGRWLAGLPEPMRAALGLVEVSGRHDVGLEEGLSDLVEAIRPRSPL